MSESEEQGASGSYTVMQLQGGSSSLSPSPRGGDGVVIGGGGAWRVNKEVTLPILMALKESLEAEMRQVKSLINMVHGGEEAIAAAAVEEEEEGDHIACQQEIQKKELADEQDRSLELQMQIEVMKLTLSYGFSAGTASSY